MSQKCGDIKTHLSVSLSVRHKTLTLVITFKLELTNLSYFSAFVETRPLISYHNFYVPAWKVRRGRLGIGSSVRPSVGPSVIMSRLQTRCKLFKVWWSYSNQTWTVSSSKCCSHFTDITCPWSGWLRGENVGLSDFAIFWLYCRLWHLCFTNLSSWHGDLDLWLLPQNFDLYEATFYYQSIIKHDVKLELISTLN